MGRRREGWAVGGARVGGPMAATRGGGEGCQDGGGAMVLARKGNGFGRFFLIRQDNKIMGRKILTS